MLPRADWTYQVEPVFLVGCGRSGSTWLQSMLACHPAIHTGPETFFFDAFAGSEKVYHYHHQMNDRRVGPAEYWSTRDYYGVIAATYWLFLSSLPEPRATPKFFLDKTPNHVLHSDFIVHTFPGARFIHLIRDCRAVVASTLRASRDWGRAWESNVDKATLRWKNLVSAGRKIPLMISSPAQYIEIKYEDLRRDPIAEITKLLEWLHLPADANLVQFAVESNRHEQMRNSKNPFSSIPMPNHSMNSVSQKPAYLGGFIGPAPVHPDDAELTRLQRLRVDRIAGSLLRELNYPDVKRLSFLQRIMVSGKLRRWLGLRPL